MDNRLKKIIIIYTSLAALLLIIGFWSQGSIVYVSKPSNSSNPTLILRERGKTDESQSSFGLRFLSRGSYVLDFNDANKKTRKTASFGAFGIHKISVSLQSEKTIEKVSTDAENCIFGSNKQLSQGVVYSYDCVTLTQIQLNDFAKRITLQPLDRYYNLYPSILYKTGVFGVRQVANEYEGRVTEAVYTRGSGADKVIKLDSFQEATLDSLLIAPGKDKIVLLDTRGGALVSLNGFPSTNSVSSSKVSLPSQEYRTISAQLFNDSVFVYSIKTPDFEGEGVIEAQINEFSVSDGGLRRSITLDDTELITDQFGGFKVLDENTLVVSSSDEGGVVSIFKMNKDSIKRTSYVTEALDFTIFEDKIIVLSFDGGVYQYLTDTKELRAVYVSDNTKLDTINQDFERITMSGRAEIDITNLTLGFVMTGQDLEEGIGLPDALPLTDEYNGVPFRLADYVGDIIYLYEGPVGYNGNSPDQNIKNTITILQESGLDLSKYKILSQ